MSIARGVLISRLNFLHHILEMEVIRNCQQGHMVTSAPLIPLTDSQLMAGESQVDTVCG